MLLWLTTIICRATTFVRTLTTVDSSAQARKRSKQQIIRRVDHSLIRANEEGDRPRRVSAAVIEYEQ